MRYLCYFFVWIIIWKFVLHQILFHFARSLTERGIGSASVAISCEWFILVLFFWDLVLSADCQLQLVFETISFVYFYYLIKIFILLLIWSCADWIVFAFFLRNIRFWSFVWKYFLIFRLLTFVEFLYQMPLIRCILHLKILYNFLQWEFTFAFFF